MITEFRLLTNQAGYANTTASDHLHLIKKLQTVLNTNLVKRVLLLDDVPTTIDKWAEKAIQIDSNYQQTMETLDRLNGDKAGHESTRGSPGSVPASILVSKINTRIRTSLFPWVTRICGSKLASTCGYL
jgi:hypothetical protein